MRLQNVLFQHIHSLSDLTPILNSADVQITFWGEHQVVAAGYEGSCYLNAISEAAFKLQKHAKSEEVLAIEITRKIDALHELCYTKAQQSNPLTQTLYKMRTIFFLNNGMHWWPGFARANFTSTLSIRDRTIRSTLSYDMQSFADISSLLENAEVHLSFWGHPTISVEGHEGRCYADTFAYAASNLKRKKYPSNIEIPIQKPSYSEEERKEARKVIYKIDYLHKFIETKAQQSNILTECFYNIRSIVPLVNGMVGWYGFIQRDEIANTFDLDETIKSLLNPEVDTLTALTPLLEDPYVHISFWGKHKVSVCGYGGSCTIEQITSTVRSIVSNKGNLSCDEKNIVRKIDALYELCNQEAIKRNLLTRLLYNIRSISDLQNRKTMQRLIDLEPKEGF